MFSIIRGMHHVFFFIFKLHTLILGKWFQKMVSTLTNHRLKKTPTTAEDDAHLLLVATPFRSVRTLQGLLIAFLKINCYLGTKKEALKAIAHLIKDHLVSKTQKERKKRCNIGITQQRLYEIFSLYYLYLGYEYILYGNSGEETVTLIDGAIKKTITLSDHATFYEEQHKRITISFTNAKNQSDRVVQFQSDYPTNIRSPLMDELNCTTDWKSYECRKLLNGTFENNCNYTIKFSGKQSYI